MIEQLKKRVLWLLSSAALLASIAAVVVVLYGFGFPLSEGAHERIVALNSSLLTFMWALVTFRFIISGVLGKSSNNPILKVLGYGLFTTISVLVLSLGFGVIQSDNFVGLVTSNSVVVILLLMVSLSEISAAVTRILNGHTNPAIILAGSFALIIFIGSMLLQLPNCSRELEYIDSLFISASAVCVTGLSTVSIAETLTTSGMVVLMMLIQIGGLGIMTITSFFGLFFSGSLSNKVMISELMSDSSLNGLLRTLIKIVAVTLSVEAAGAALIYFSIYDVKGIDNPVFFSVFHSVSAFCNAGFSTLSGNLYNPLVRNLGSLMWIVSFLIIFGGIGFPIFVNFLSVVWHYFKNLVRMLFRIRILHSPRKWSLNTYIVVKITVILIMVSWVAILALEWNHSLAEFGFWDKLAQGFLAAVTPRTAGFNGVDIGKMVPASILITIVLMWIGGAPQSTAGGVKVTTVYLAIKNIFTSTSPNLAIESQNRTIPNYSVRRAFAVIMLSMIVISVSVIMLSIFEPQIELSRLIFETVSAIGTVGLTLGVTPELGTESKVVVIMLMYIGRVGVVTIFMLFIRRNTYKSYSYPSENILIN